MPLTGKQRRSLRALAHGRRPAVTLGAAGLTPAVLAEIETALEHHELLKLKIQAGDSTERSALVQEICAKTHAEPVQAIGRTALIYRPAANPRLRLTE